MRSPGAWLLVRIGAAAAVVILGQLPGSGASALASAPPTGCSVSWHRVPAPDPTVDGDAGLEGVAAIGPDDVWAVGGYDQGPGTFFRTLAMHWDGRRWAIVPSPNGPRTNAFSAVDGVASDDVWAVGTIDFEDPLIERWDGTGWEMVPAPGPSHGGPDQLYDVEAISADDVWAVGVDFSQDEPSALHWNGIAWSVVPTPTRGQLTALHSISAISSSEAWSVGTFSRTILGRTETFTQTWDGTTWVAVKSPSVESAPENELRALDARTSDDLWATGFVAVGGRYRSLAMHWDGDRWRIAPSPSPGSDFNSLSGVEVIGPAEAWAVGLWADSGAGNRTLVARWDGTAWNQVRSPDPPDAISARLLDVSAIDGVVWAVGDTVYAPDQSAPLVERACPG